VLLFFLQSVFCVSLVAAIFRSFASMLITLAYFLSVFPLVVLSLGFLPASVCQQHRQQLCRWLPPAFLLFFIINLVSLALTWQQEPLDLVYHPLPWGLGLGIYFDSLTAVILSLISWIGWIIVRYSVRYLNGEEGQGDFLRWLGFTLAAVILMVLARNLAMLAGAWMLSSWGLHRLLLHYPDRPWALWTARKKFLISRLGDLLLLLGIGLVWGEFGTLAYRDLFDLVPDRVHQLASGEGGLALTWIGILFAVGGMTKSAQFPFHSWLPDTMETPTPVSALMHAGVINAGGFLIIRLSPVICLSPPALNLLLLVGGFTALFASIVLLTQTSVKRALAWSTVAQMGFMMLQCGLGAFSAATLHILAHSLYKAHAFLISGSVVDSMPGVRAKMVASQSNSRGLVSFPLLLLSGGLVMAMVGINWLLISVDGLGSKSLLFGLILALAFFQLLATSLRFGSVQLSLVSGLIGLLICLSYWAWHFSIDLWLNQVAIGQPPAWSWLDITLMTLVAMGFAGVFLLQILAHYYSRWHWIQAIYVHAGNGFYLDIPARRLTAWLYGLHSASP